MIIKNSIYQVDDNENIVKKWDSTQQIAAELDDEKTLMYQAFDQALKKGFRSHGFFWFWAKEWDDPINPKRPNPVVGRRNILIFAYKPEKELKSHEYNDLTVDHGELQFVGKFANAVMCAIYLDIDVSNIRCVIHGKDSKNKIKRLHKGYFFSYVPLNLSDNESEILKPSERQIKTYRRSQKKYIKA
jgi:hypothetical protein